MWSSHEISYESNTRVPTSLHEIFLIWSHMISRDSHVRSPHEQISCETHVKLIIMWTSATLENTKQMAGCLMPSHMIWCHLMWHHMNSSDLMQSHAISCHLMPMYANNLPRAGIDLRRSKRELKWINTANMTVHLPGARTNFFLHFTLGQLGRPS